MHHIWNYGTWTDKSLTDNSSHWHVLFINMHIPSKTMLKPKKIEKSYDVPVKAAKRELSTH